VKVFLWWQGGLLYFKVFARTMQREWFGIDRLRLDKFMLLARKFVHQLFALLRQSDWCARVLCTPSFAPIHATHPALCILASLMPSGLVYGPAKSLN
jgi:hypothetical protein